jgi:hypothetical protein
MSDYLDNVEKQLAQLTERGTHRRPIPRTTIIRPPRPGRRVSEPDPDNGRPSRSRRRDALVVVPALLVVVAVLVVVMSLGSSGPTRGAAGRSTATQQHGPPGHRSRLSTSAPAALSSAPARKLPTYRGPVPSGPVPPGFAAQSFTAIGTAEWWLLGTAPCSQPPCTSIVRTDDGGHSFVGTPAPRTTAVTQLRFADAGDGFAYDPELWVTHNAGGAWHQLPIGGSVSDLAIADGYAYAIVKPAGSGAGRLLRAAIGSDRWTPLTGAGNTYTGLWAHGSDVLLETSDRSGDGNQLAVSRDAGAHFTRYPAPPSVTCDFQEPAPPVVWAHCATGTASATFRSTAYGAGFRAAGGPRNLSGAASELPNSAAFAAASAATAVVGSQQLYRTTDAGVHYAPVPGTSAVSAWRYLGFTNATHGVALGFQGPQVPDNERLYYTSDGGATYHYVPIG